MNTSEVLDLLATKSDPKMKAHHIKNGAQENLFGAKMGDIRAIAKTIKSDHELGMGLWETGNMDAQLLATLIVKPKLIEPSKLEEMVQSVVYTWLADWLNSNVVKQHPDKESLRLLWMEKTHPMLRRSAWSLTGEKVTKDPSSLDLNQLLDRIELEMGNAPEAAQWTMNFCLGEIGIKFPEHRARALAIGEKIGLYKDYPVSKGCTSPYVPIWINEMASRL